MYSVFEWVDKPGRSNAKGLTAAAAAAEVTRQKKVKMVNEILESIKSRLATPIVTN